MDTDELAAKDLLQTVTYPVASWDKRFARHIGEMNTISEKEVPQLWRLLYKYRRQWQHGKKPYLLSKALRLSAPDFRKVEAAKRDQARIDEMKRKYAEVRKPGRVFELD